MLNNGMAKYSKYIGVTFDKRRNKWVAMMKHNQKTKFLGYFLNEEDAYARRLEEEKLLEGERFHDKKDIKKEEIVKMYISGKHISEIANHFNNHYSSIYEILIKGNVEIRDDKIPVLSFDEKTNMIKDYNEYMTLENMVGKYGYSRPTILKAITGHVNYRPSKKYYLKDDNCFSNIDEEWKAYFIGLFYADGNMRDITVTNNKSSSISISLTEKDSYILDRLNNVLFKDPSKIYYKPLTKFISNITNKECVIKPSRRLNIHSKIVYNDLLSLGCHPNKSLTIELPPLSDDMFPHFLRGYMDGDGWYTRKYSFGLIGSYKFCEQIKEKINNLTGINMKLRSCGKVCRLIKESKADYTKFREYIYSNSDPNLCLTRKRDR